MDAEWNWQNQPVGAPFGQAGRIGIDHQEPAQATLLYIHRLDSTNTDRGGNLTRITRHDRIYLQQKTAATSWHRYEATGRSKLEADCWIIPVTTDVGSPHGTEPPNATPLLVSIP